MTTIQDVAKHAAVSVSTVSIVLGRPVSVVSAMAGYRQFCSVSWCGAVPLTDHCAALLDVVLTLRACRYAR